MDEIGKIIDRISQSNDYLTIITHIFDLKMFSDEIWHTLDRDTKILVITQMVCYLEVERDFSIEEWTTQKYNEVFKVK